MARLFKSSDESVGVQPANGKYFVERDIDNLLRHTNWVSEVAEGGVIIYVEEGDSPRPFNLAATKVAHEYITGPALLLDPAEWRAFVDGSVASPKLLTVKG